MATKVKKRSERRAEARKELEVEENEKKIDKKSESFKWLLFAITILCLWILANYSA